MKKLMAVALGGVLSLFAFQADVQAGDDSEFVTKVKTFFDNAQDKIDSIIAQVKAKINSPEVQAKLEEIRAEHRAALKEVLLAVYPKIKAYRENVLEPLVNAKIQVAVLKLEAKLIDNLKIFKAQASKAYEAELDKLITKLPDNVEAQVRALRASPQYQEKRAEVIAKIDALIQAQIEKSGNKFVADLQDFVNVKLDDLDARIMAKIESL